MSGTRVVVVGGGLAGLSAAIACADGGANVTLLEARARLGGATFSFLRNGLSIDNGQHVFLRCCTAYRAFLARIGAQGATVLQPRMSIPVRAPGGRTGTLRRTSLPPPLHLAGALVRYPFLSAREKLGVGRAVLALRRLRPNGNLDRRTFGSWLAQHGQSPGAVEALWNLIALPTLNLPAEQASLALAVKVFQTGLLQDESGADVGYARVPLSRVHAEPAARVLAAAGAEIRTRAPVRRVERSVAGGLDVVAEEGVLSADAVIVAVPHDAVQALLPPDAVAGQERLAELGSSPIVNLHVIYDRLVMDVPFTAGVGTPVQWVFDRTGPSGLTEGQYLAVSLSGADGEIRVRTEDLRRRFVPALAELFPRARSATVERFFVTREHAATFRQAPGTAALRPGPRTRVPGLFLAGAWTDTGWPATMESAVRSGTEAAREVLRAAGSTVGLPQEVPA